MRQPCSSLEARYTTDPAVLSDDALGVLVPILEEIAGRDATQIRALFEAHGFAVQEWNKVRTDSVTIRETGAAAGAAAE